MTKLEIQQRVLKNGTPLSLELFSWDENTNTFSSKEDILVIDFTGIDNCTFNTSSNCTFKADSNCTFETGYNCTFDTGSDCTFETGSDCTFDTSYNCTFKTGPDCTFKTGSRCTFNFKAKENCVIIRRDIFEIINMNEIDSDYIQLNPYETEGYLVKIDNKMYLNGDKNLGEHIIIDNILSKVISIKL